MFKNLESPTTTKICWLGCRRTSWQGLISSNINGLLCPLWSKRAMLHCVQWKTKHRGSPAGWCFQSVLFFLYTCGRFLPELLRTPAQCRRTRESWLLLFFAFLFFLFYPPSQLASWVQAATGNSPDVRPESKQRAAGVVCWKTSSAVPLISGDREEAWGGEEVQEACVGVSLARRCASVCRNSS